MKSREALITHSGSQRDGGGRAGYGVLTTLANFIPLSWLLVSFVSMKNNIEVGRLAQLVFNSILFLGLRSPLPGNVLIGSLPVPSVTLLFPREPGITITVFEPVLFDHCSIFALSSLIAVVVGEGRSCPTSRVRVECGDGREGGDSYRIEIITLQIKDLPLRVLPFVILLFLLHPYLPEFTPPHLGQGISPSAVGIQS